MSWGWCDMDCRGMQGGNITVAFHVLNYSFTTIASFVGNNQKKPFVGRHLVCYDDCQQ